MPVNCYKARWTDTYTAARCNNLQPFTVRRGEPADERAERVSAVSTLSASEEPKSTRGVRRDARCSLKTCGDAVQRATAIAR
eukprot:scaffold10480_cov57-Phaeocystis_antarctica.AAC.2